MEFQEVNHLYQDYQQAAQSHITKEQFDTLFMFFPSLLVVASDGVIDDEEWIYVKYLGKFMADTFKEEVSEEERQKIEDSYLQELKFLLQNLSKWEPKFIGTLKTYLSKHEEAKEDIVDILYLFAEASDGLSEEEEEKIDQLKDTLDLNDVDV